MSGWTMKRALKRVGLFLRVKQKKPKLSSKHILRLIRFCKEESKLDYKSLKEGHFF